MIVAKHKFEEYVLVAASVKHFLVSLAKVFSFSEFLQ